jgi:hypothetical protein
VRSLKVSAFRLGIPTGRKHPRSYRCRWARPVRLA